MNQTLKRDDDDDDEEEQLFVEYVVVNDKPPAEWATANNEKNDAILQILQHTSTTDTARRENDTPNETGFSTRRKIFKKTKRPKTEIVSLLDENERHTGKQQCITLEESKSLKCLLLGDLSKHFSDQWKGKGYPIKPTNKQKWYYPSSEEGSPAVAIAILGHMLKALLHEPGFSEVKEPLQPNADEVTESLCYALTNIIWSAGNYTAGIIIKPTKKQDEFENNVSEEYEYNGITDNFTYNIYYNFDSLKTEIVNHLDIFSSSPYNGFLNLIICVILSRGIKNIRKDTEGEIALIEDDDSCSLELLMLLTVGRAISNTFGSYIKGSRRKPQIGFLTPDGCINQFRVGNYLKNPQYPIWIMYYQNHYSILYSNDSEIVNKNTTKLFTAYHYDSQLQKIEYKLLADPMGTAENNEHNIFSDEFLLCCKTKWPKVVIISYKTVEDCIEIDDI